MKLLSREQVLKVSALPVETVNVPDWQGAVCVRTLSGREKDAWESANYKGKGKNRQLNLDNVRARLIVLCLVDENGNRLLSEQDAGPLGNQSARALDLVFDVACRLNAVGEQDIEDMVGNSNSGPSAASTSALPSPSAKP